MRRCAGARVRGCALLCVVVLAATLSAQTVAPQAPPAPTRDTPALAPTGTAVVSGVVVDDENKPVRRASVRFEGDARASRIALTDDKGAFVAANLPAARYTIRAERAGFAAGEYGAKRAGRPGAGLTVKDGDRVENIVLHMARGAVLEGRVLDEKGRPMPGVSVTAYRVVTRLGGNTDIEPVVRSGSAFPLTDDRGVFRFYGLAADEYIVGMSPFASRMQESVRVLTDAQLRDVFGGGAARASRAISTDTPAVPAGAVSPPMNYATVFYGDTTDPLASTRVRLAPGEERTGLDLHVKLEPRASVHGIIAGPDPLPTLSVELMHKTTVQGLAVTTVSPSRTGSVIDYPNLAPGDYVLSVRTTGVPALAGETTFTLGGADLNGVRVDLQPAATITGQVVFSGSALEPPDPATITLSLPLVTGFGRSVAPKSAAITGSAFVVDSVMPGTFRVLGNVRSTAKPGEPAWTMSSVMLGDRDVTDLPVEISAGQTLPPVTVTFTDTPSELSGRILLGDGKPGTDYFVIALPSDERYWVWNSRRIKSVRPDASGRYVLPAMPAGTYRIAVVTELEQGDLRSLPFLRDLVGASAEVKIGVSEKKVFDLKLGGSSSERRP